jgi:DEAD/DEAH box helicase domain-containing protein
MDEENSRITLLPAGDDYFTEPRQKSSVLHRATYTQEDLAIGQKSYGEIQVTSQVTGYKRIDFQTNEVISTHQLEMPEIHLITTGTWLGISDRIIDALRKNRLWNDDRNNYGPNWQIQREKTLERDGYTCQVCGRSESSGHLHVHHKTPFKHFSSYLEANKLHNLITLCSSCHQKAETVVRIRSGLGGLGHVLHHLAPLLLMCSYEDIGVFADSNAAITDGNPCVLFYDQAPAGIGLSESLYKKYDQVLADALNLVTQCECAHGCPSCVGAPGENATGAKQYTQQLLVLLNQ